MPVTKPSNETFRLPPVGSQGFFSQEEVAAHLTVCKSQIKKWVHNDKLCEHSIGRRKIYCKAEVNWRVANGLLPIMPRPRPKGEVKR